MIATGRHEISTLHNYISTYMYTYFEHVSRVFKADLVDGKQDEPPRRRLEGVLAKRISRNSVGVNQIVPDRY